VKILTHCFSDVDTEVDKQIKGIKKDLLDYFGNSLEIQKKGGKEIPNEMEKVLLEYLHDPDSTTLEDSNEVEGGDLESIKEDSENEVEREDREEENSENEVEERGEMSGEESVDSEESVGQKKKRPKID